jgi:hypothetical protein
MPREGAIIFRDLLSTCSTLSAQSAADEGRYHLDKLIARYGNDEKLFAWSDEITADCPHKQAKNLNDICGARCPDLPKVVCDWDGGSCVALGAQQKRTRQAKVQTLSQNVPRRGTQRRWLIVCVVQLL